MYITIGIDENGKPFATFEKSEPIKRPEKGKSLLDFPKDYTVIDIETTGLDVRFCEIIEVSAIKYRDNVEVDRFDTLVKPSEEIDDFITSLTGITNEMLSIAPDIRTAVSDFYSFIGNDTLVGYNVNFDINFLYDNLVDYNSVPLKNSFVDVMRLSKRLLPDLKNHKLETVSSHFNTSPSTHRSLDDCIACNECFSHLKEEAIKQYGSVEEFLHICAPHKRKTSAKDIVSTATSFDENNPLFGKTVCFTGALEKMVRKDAMQLVVDLGGSCSDSVTKSTNYLVLGNNDFCTSIKDGKSSKHKKAESMILKGGDIEILSENAFYEMVLCQ